MSHGELRDRDVRNALKAKVLSEHITDPNTLVLDELGLQHGASRVDIAVINGFIHGYEIKSDADTLDRLPTQILIYGSVLDRATLVVSEKHVEKASRMLPEWWGIRLVKVGPRGGIEFPTARSHGKNLEFDPIAMAGLLWRPEVVEILRTLGVSESLLRQPRAVLYRILAETVQPNTLRKLVTQRLKAREGWRGRTPLSTGACS